jgi:hypothetical protein
MSATDLRSRRYMRLVAHLPSILHPSPDTAALLGVGLGVTAMALTEDPRFTSIDAVDISPDIPAMLPIVYPDARDNPLRDARVRLHVEDGRFFLGAARQRYDVITAEPPPPRCAGVANLEALFRESPSDPLLVKALFWRHHFDFDRARALLGAEPGLQGPGVAEYRAQLALMNGSPRQAADWLAQSVSPRARELLTIRAYCLLRAGERAAAERLLRASAPPRPNGLSLP